MTTTSVTIADLMDRPSRHLLAHSALAGCTATTGNVVTKLWPRLSDGEALLWDVLAGINGVGDLPTDEALRAGLDAPNRSAAEWALNYRVGPWVTR